MPTTRGELDGGRVLCRSPRNSVEPSAIIPSCCARRDPAHPPRAKVIRSSAAVKRHVRRAWRSTVFGSRSVKMRWLQPPVVQTKRRTLSSILTATPSQGRSATGAYTDCELGVKPDRIRDSGSPLRLVAVPLTTGLVHRSSVHAASLLRYREPAFGFSSS